MLTNSPNASATTPDPQPSDSPRSSRLTRQEFNQQLWRAIIPPLLLLTAHAAVITMLFLYFLRASGWARNTEQALGGIKDVERLIVNMETSVRGRLLTGDESFFRPYLRARPRVEPALERLRELTADEDPAQLARIENVRRLYYDWLAAEQELPTRAVGTVLPPQAHAVIARRRDLVDRIREQLREMSMAGLELQRTRYDREERAARLALLGGVGMSVLLGVALALFNRRTVLRLSATYQQVLDEEAATGRQFADLAETIPQLIWISDGTGRHTYFNKTWREYSGRTAADLAGRGWLESVHADEADAARARWEKAVRDGTPFEGEYRLRAGVNGSYRWFLCRAMPVVDADGRRTRWFGSCTDIESQKQITRERERALATERAARSDLVRQSRTKDEFLATLSHELRTPMTAILGWARLLRDPKVRDSNLGRAIDAIEANARAQARLIEDLLDMSRINAGKLALKMETVDLLQVVRAAIESVGPAAANKKVSLHLTDPGGAREVRLTGDSARLQQVLWNLLTNAVKFTPAGGRITVTVTTTDESLARVTVSDTGQGIDPAFLPHVFQRFRQADGSTTRQHGGLGLGLAIVQHLVEMHGGNVSAASDGVGRGATLTVELPLRSAPSGRAAAPEQTPREIVTGKRVLLVDDDHSSVAVMKLALEMAGCRVETADGAAPALQSLRAGQFDALVSDIGMPDTDGYGLIRLVREAEPPGQRRLPAIALTAFARAEDRAAALDAGFDSHLAKPVTPDQLVAALAGVFRPAVAAAAAAAATAESRD